ncbi:hypothetical protein SAMN05421507_12328 [Lentzea jiangxiensis]|uniref:Uncharacterized protein n=1 Tax=Lentzea jiangxiensis TaxID=641025 RepID=A0A1H0WTK1_9PSEU|nr:hypothetical protein SAMN05421507_12328 [Lentzea jiangxiensis]
MRSMLSMLPKGPSPRARGALPGQHANLLARWTIPACAGSTAASSPSARRRRDHPRVRGEHIARGTQRCRVTGPSPRARGARHPRRHRRLPAGTIPACAGSTPAMSRPSSTAWDHPRVRGEHRPAWRISASRPGPSPRARGAQCLAQRGVALAGTIPACAGSTPGRARRPPRDHPRVRGEHTLNALCRLVAHGPSPRARGAPLHPLRTLLRLRTIPACAGSTRRHCTGWGGTRDHPRVRGEHTS